MHDSRPISLPLANHFILSKEQSPANEEEEEYMSKISYSNAIGSGPTHWEALKWLLKYLSGTYNVGLVYKCHFNSVKLKGFTDSDHAGDKDNKKSMSSYVFTLCDSCIGWKSHLQHIVAFSTTESEYITTICWS